MSRTVKGLPGRYNVGWSVQKQKHLLDDGSNFVMWLPDNITDNEIRKLAEEHQKEAAERRAKWQDEYFAKMQADPEGYRHAGCDHAYGICNG